MNENVEPRVEVMAPSVASVPWVRCTRCRTSITLGEWRGLRVDVTEAAQIVLAVHQKRCLKKS